MLNKAKEIFKWLENKAGIYLCGAANPMGKDVEKTLIEIIHTQGKMTKEKAVNYFNNMVKEKRFLKETY